MPIRLPCRIDLTDEAARRFRQGQRLPGIPGSPGPYAVHGADGRVLGLAQLDEGRVLAPQRLFNWEPVGGKGEPGAAKAATPPETASASVPK